MQEGRAAERDSRAVGAANITSSKYWRMPRPRPGERRNSAQTAINAPSSLKKTQGALETGNPKGSTTKQ